MKVIRSAPAGQAPPWMAGALAISLGLLLLGSFRSWRDPNDLSERGLVIPPSGSVGWIAAAGAPDLPICMAIAIRSNPDDAAAVVLAPLHPFARPGEPRLLQTYTALVESLPPLLFRSPGEAGTVRLERVAARRPPPPLIASSALMDDLVAFTPANPPSAALQLAAEELETGAWVDVAGMAEKGGAAALVVQRASVYSISPREVVLTLRTPVASPAAPGAPALNRMGELSALAVGGAGDGVTLLAIPSREIRARLMAGDTR